MSSQVDEEDIMMTNVNEELSRVTNNNDEFSLNSMTIPQPNKLKAALKHIDMKKKTQAIKKPLKNVKAGKKTRIQEAKMNEPKKGLKIKSPKKLAETEVLFCNASYEVAVPNMFKQELNALEKKKDRTAYNRMAKEASLSDEPCIVCNHITGLKTKCTGGETAHIICGLMSDNFEINFTTMLMALIEPIKPTEGVSCNICASETGQQLRCLKKSCKQSVHVFCLMEQRRHQLIKPPTPLKGDDSSSEEEDEITGWQVEIKIQDYSKQKFLQQYDCLKPLLENLDFLKVSKPQDMELLTPENTPQKPNSSPRVLQNKLPPRFNLPKRGGKVSIVCEEHRSEPTHCYCGSESQQLHMLMCDYCQKWFHTKCEGLKSTEAQLLKEYKCTLCASWIEKVESVLMPAIVGTNNDVLYQNQEDFKTWECWKRSILPLQKLPVKLSDCVLMAQIWQKQTQQLIKEVVSIQMIKQQILVAQHIPLYLDVSALNERISKASKYQQNHPYSEAKIKSVLVGGMVDLQNRKQNSKCADEIQMQIERELEVCELVTQQAEELQFQVISQNKIVEDAVGVIFDSKQISFERLEEIASEIDAVVQEELAEKIGVLFKETKKWAAFESKNKTIADVLQHISSAPAQVDLTPQCQKLKDEITVVQTWTDQYGMLNGIERLNHIKSVTQLGLKSDLTIKIAAALKTVGIDNFKFCSNIERQTRCISQLSDAIQKLAAQPSEVSKDFHTYLTAVKAKVDKLQDHLSEVNEGKTTVTLESLLQLQSQAVEMAVLVPGEVLLNQAVEVLLFATKKQNSIQYEFLTQFKCSLTSDTRMELEQITASVNDIQNRILQAQEGLQQHQELTSQNLDNVVVGVKQLARLNSDLKQIGVIKSSYDFSKLDQFFIKLLALGSQNCDLITCLQTAKKEIVCQLTTQLELILKSIDFCPFLSNLKTSLEQLKKTKNVGACLSGKLSLKKLEEMIKSCGTDDKVKAQIDQQLALTKEWYSKFHPLSMTDSQLRKKLAGGEYEALIALVEQLEQDKASIKLDITDTESKVISRIKKWASTVRDCHRVMTEEFQIDDLMSILQTLKELKSLPQEIPICKQAQERIGMVQQFVQSVEQIIQDGKPDTIQQIRDRLLKAASEITINIEALVKEYNYQIEASQKWLLEAEKDDCDATALLKQVKEDKEGDLNLVSEQAVQRLRVKSLKNLFKPGKSEVKQFIACIEKQREMLCDEELSDEKAVFDLAKKVKQMSDGKKKVDFTLAEAKMISNSATLPFIVPAQCATTLSQMNDQLVSIQKQVESLVAHGDARIQNFDQQLCALKTLQIRSELEEELQQMSDDIKFAIQLQKMITDFNSKNTILYDDLKRVQKLQQDAKIKCPEADQCVLFLTEERDKFDALQKKISSLNVEGAVYTYQQLFNAQVEITELKVDFQQKERGLRTDLWHLRLDKFVKELELDYVTDLEDIQADLLRYWLEDAQDLELTKDPKYDILNDLCDAVDQCYRAFRLVTTQSQFGELKAFISSEVCKRLLFTRAESEVKINGEEGDINPKAYLQRLVSAKKDDSDVQMTNLEAESSDDSDGEVTGEDEVHGIIKQPTKKREKKALEKKDSSINKVVIGSTKKIEEMKQRMQKNKTKVDSNKEKQKPEVKDKQQVSKAAKKVKTVVASSEPAVAKGIAGGLKIGGGIKQKLGNFKKKTFNSPSSKVAEVKHEVDAEPVVEKGVVPQDDQKMEEEAAVEKIPVKAAKKPVMPATDKTKPAVKQKAESKVPKVETKEVAQKQTKGQKKEISKPEPKPAAKIVAKPGKIIGKPAGKPAKKVEESKEQPETEADSPKPAAKAALLTKPIIGIKRKPMGSLAASLGKPSGLAASLKKLN